MRRKPRSQWLLVLAALAMLALAVVIVLDRSAQRMGLLDRVFAWFAAKAGAEHARDAALDSPLVIGLVAGALVLVIVALARAMRR